MEEDLLWRPSYMSLDRQHKEARVAIRHSGERPIQGKSQSRNNSWNGERSSLFSENRTYNSPQNAVTKPNN